MATEFSMKNYFFYSRWKTLRYAKIEIKIEGFVELNISKYMHHVKLFGRKKKKNFYGPMSRVIFLYFYFFCVCF